MPIFFDTNEIDDPQTRQAVERAIGEFLGDRPEEHWRIQIESRSEYYRVSVKGPGPMRRHYFFEQPEELPQAIRNWLELYPLY